jgi:hypothetical protein
MHTKYASGLGRPRQSQALAFLVLGVRYSAQMALIIVIWLA